MHNGHRTPAPTANTSADCQHQRAHERQCRQYARTAAGGAGGSPVLQCRARASDRAITLAPCSADGQKDRGKHQSGRTNRFRNRRHRKCGNAEVAA